MINITDVSNYKNCSKKSYDLYVCMPPLNTVVFNKLEQVKLVNYFNGLTYFTVETLEKMKKSGDPRLDSIKQAMNSGKAHVVTKYEPFVVCGTVGELWTVTTTELSRNYTFVQDGQPLAINRQTVSERLKGDYLDWTLIRISKSLTQGQSMACFLPEEQKGSLRTKKGTRNFNEIGVSHGKGDFLVCSKSRNGNPDFFDKEIVNGEVFATTYNNKGWTDCLNLSKIKTIKLENLPNLLPKNAKTKGIGQKIFRDTCESLMRELITTYKFELKDMKFSTRTDYTDSTEDAEEYDIAYVADFRVSGNFSIKLPVRNKETGIRTEKTITEQNVMITFTCSALESNTAIDMIIMPLSDNNKRVPIQTWTFPDKTIRKKQGVSTCKVGTIANINCADEVRIFTQKCQGRDAYIDNRKSC